MSLSGAGIGASQGLEQVLERRLRELLRQQQEQQAAAALEQRKVEEANQQQRFLKQFDLESLKRTDALRREDTQRNAASDMAGVLALPGMSNEAKANEIMGSGLRTGLVDPARVIEGLTRVAPRTPLHSVTVPGPGGRPMAKGVTDEQLQAGVETYQAPKESKPAFEWVRLPDGNVAQVEKGTAPEGSKPYSASEGGLAAVQVQTRNRRAAAALNSVEKLKTLAPKRTPGPQGIIEGIGDVAKGYAGYNTQTRQFQALIQPTAMQMAVAIQGAANLSDTERETMARMLGSISTMDYESQMALLDNALELIRNGADVQKITVKDPQTGKAVTRWAEAPRSQPLAVTLPPTDGSDVDAEIAAARARRKKP